MTSTDTSQASATETTTTVLEGEATGRAFLPNDYRRFAKLVQRARQVKGNRYEGKSDATQAKVDMLAESVAAIFQADSDDSNAQWSPFDINAFMAGTALEVLPVADTDDDESDEF
jgi:hypothetical protein